MGERLAGIKPLERSCRRWQLYVCSWIYEELCTSACPRGFETHVEAVSPPDTVLSVADLPIRDTILAVYAGQTPATLDYIGAELVSSKANGPNR